MNIIVEEKEYCRLQVKYEIDGEEVSNKRDEIVHKFKAHKMPGFRQGHASLQAIKIFYRRQIEEELVKELAEDAVHNVLFEKSIKPFSQPRFSVINLVSDNKFVCEFSIDKQPDFELGQYKEFEIPKLPLSRNIESLMQEMLQELRIKYGSEVPYTAEDFVQTDDKVIIDYEGSVDGVLDPKLTASGSLLRPSDILISGFGENILGMKIGDTREFELRLPENFATVNAGKVMQFKVTVQMGSKIQPAALDDELAKKAGQESMDKLMEELGSAAATKIKELETIHTNDQLVRRLISMHDFDIPSWVTTMEAQMNARNSSVGWDKMMDEDKEKALKNAADSIRLSLILQKIRDLEPDSQLTDEEVYKIAIENISKYSPDPEKSIQEIYKNGHLQILFSRIKDEHTVNFIAKTCKIVE